MFWGQAFTPANKSAAKTDPIYMIRKTSPIAIDSRANAFLFWLPYFVVHGVLQSTGAEERDQSDGMMLIQTDNRSRFFKCQL